MKLVLLSLLAISSCLAQEEAEFLSERVAVDEEGDRPLLFTNSEPEKHVIIGGNHYYSNELKHGSVADLFASNPHYNYPRVYDNLGRRQQENAMKNLNNQRYVDPSLVPKKASPEFVLAVAKKSLKEQAGNGNLPTDFVPKDALRSGDFWDAVYVENLDPNDQLRTAKSGLKRQNKLSRPQKLHFIRATVPPESEYYELISLLTKISPRLVYIVNNKVY